MKTMNTPDREPVEWVDPTIDTATRKDELKKPVRPQHCNHDGFWNSQWSTNILLSLAFPDVLGDIRNDLVDFYRDGGLRGHIAYRCGAGTKCDDGSNDNPPPA